MAAAEAKAEEKPSSPQQRKILLGNSEYLFPSEKLQNLREATEAFKQEVFFLVVVKQN